MSIPEDTDPGSPTGLRRSIAAQAGELEQLRVQVSTMRSTHAADIEQLQHALRESLDDGEEARRVTMVATAKLMAAERQIRHERIAAVCFVLTLLSVVALVLMGQGRL